MPWCIPRTGGFGVTMIRNLTVSAKLYTVATSTCQKLGIPCQASQLTSFDFQKMHDRSVIVNIPFARLKVALYPQETKHCLGYNGLLDRQSVHHFKWSLPPTTMWNIQLP